MQWEVFSYHVKKASAYNELGCFVKRWCEVDNNSFLSCAVLDIFLTDFNAYFKY